VNQTLQFYKGQQGGTAPQRLFLSGGASIMPYTAQFFAEKLNIPVEYFNPFRNVQIDPSVDLEELSRVAHGLGEVVGLGLRNLANCPVEMNLMPESTLRWQALNQKKPYLVATVFSLVLVLFVIGYLFAQLAANKDKTKERLSPQVDKLTTKSERFKRAYGSLQKSEKQADQISGWLQQRFYWGDFIGEMRLAMIRSEQGVKKKLAAQNPRIEAGIWIEQMISSASLAGGVATMNDPSMNMAPRMPEGGAQPQAAPAVDASGQPTTATNLITLICRAVDLTKNGGDASANIDMAHEVESEIKNSPMVVGASTSLVGSIVSDDPSGTVTFQVNVAPTNAPTFTQGNP
jgi:hypothetical protein